MILNSGIGNYVISNGKRYSYFAGNNYLGLANHPEVKEAVIRAVEKYGVNFSASRRTTGTADIHLELEKHLAGFKGRSDAVVFASGYQGNGILLEVLKGRYSSVCADRFAHASINAAIPPDITITERYDHCNPESLDAVLRKMRAGRPLVITDGIFALTGEIAPLDRIYPVVKKHNGILVVDDAHATGVLGKTGKGTPEYFGLQDEESIFQTETMSKALGSYGGFIAGSSELTDLIRERSFTYQASTALPPPVVAAGIASLKIITENPQLRVRLHENASLLREEIIRMGFRTTDFETPVIPIVFSSADMARRLSSFLEDCGFIVPFMNYPVSQEQHQVRIAVSALHTSEQVAGLSGSLKQWIDKNGKA